jgi:hypothetical protein
VLVTYEIVAPLPVENLCQRLSSATICDTARGSSELILRGSPLVDQQQRYGLVLE